MTIISHQPPHSHRQGFTLIEIVMVLVLLGILSAVAVPKYFDLQTQAQRRSAEQALQALQAEINGNFAQALLSGQSCQQFVASLGGGGNSDKTSTIFTDFVDSFNSNSKDMKIDVDNRSTGFFLYAAKSLKELGGTNNSDDKLVGQIVLPQCN